MDAAITYARFASTFKYDDLPVNVVEAVKKEVLDTLGAIIAGSTANGTKEVVELLREFDRGGSSTVVGYKGKVSPPSAAMANGLMAHALDYDDTLETAHVHPGCTAIPAAFAVAEKKGGISGRDFITAVVLGVEITSRMSLATRLGPVQTGWIYTPLYGYFGAAVTAARILGLGEEGIINAMGLAYSQAAGNQQGVYDGTLTKRLQAGFAARGGVLSAFMAAKGITGPKNSFEGQTGIFNLIHRGDYFPEILTKDLGKRFEVVDLSYKPYPCCRLAHTCIYLAILLVKEHKIRPEDIVEVIATTEDTGIKLLCDHIEVKRKPRSIVDAQFSLPFTVAAALVYGEFTPGYLTEAGIRDPKILDMAQKVFPKLAPESLAKHGDHAGILEIRTRDGKTYRKTLLNAYGHPENPIDVTAKFRDCVPFSSKRIPKANAERVVELTSKLETLEDASEIIKLLG